MIGDTAVIDMHLASSANARWHWAKRARIVKAQRNAGRTAAQKILSRTGALTPPLLVTITRVAPRPVDSDNLQTCAKGARDGIADALGIDDGSPLIRWEYAQAKGPSAVVIRIEETGLRLAVTP